MLYYEPEEAAFNMWFVLNEERIRKLRDAYELRTNSSIHIRAYALWLYLDLSPNLLYLTNPN